TSTRPATPWPTSLPAPSEAPPSSRCAPPSTCLRHRPRRWPDERARRPSRPPRSATAARSRSSSTRAARARPVASSLVVPARQDDELVADGEVLADRPQDQLVLVDGELDEVVPREGLGREGPAPGPPRPRGRPAHHVGHAVHRVAALV